MTAEKKEIRSDFQRVILNGGIKANHLFIKDDSGRYVNILNVRWLRRSDNGKMIMLVSYADALVRAEVPDLTYEDACETFAALGIQMVDLKDVHDHLKNRKRVMTGPGGNSPF